MSETHTQGARQRVLVIGGAGHVGQILRPALEAAHDVRYFDLRPVPDAEDRTTVGSVTDAAAVERAVADVESVIYLAMGRFLGEGPESVADVATQFDVNVQGVYRVLRTGLRAGVQRFVYASTLSVYQLGHHPRPLDESHVPDKWEPYGTSKWLGECVCRTASLRHRDATLIALRLMLPRNDEQHRQDLERARERRAGQAPQHNAQDGQHSQDTRGRRRRRGGRSAATGPRDTQRLFLAALDCTAPGFHVVQATGDTEGTRYPNHRARELLGWWPAGE